MVHPPRHRAAFRDTPAVGAVDLAERVSGDTAAAHSLGYCLAVEEAADIPVREEVHRLRALLVELERLYNHATDLDALANDVGFCIANAHAQRIREQLLRINATVTGHRLLRGAIRPGAVALRSLPDPGNCGRSRPTCIEVTELTLANNVSETGSPAPRRCQGTTLAPSAASGTSPGPHRSRIDARLEHPTIALPVTEIGEPAGDVLARYTVRRDEFAASIALAGALVDIPHRPRPNRRHPSGSVARAPESVSSKAGAAPLFIASRSTPTHASPAPRSSTRPGLTGLLCRSRWPTDRSRLPTRQQELRLVLCRQRPLRSDNRPSYHYYLLRFADKGN